MNNQEKSLLDLATTVQFEEKDLISKFEVEELEKRFEMGWGTLNMSVNYTQQSGLSGTISYSMKI